MPEDYVKEISQINKKVDAIMSHLGVGKVSEEEYMDMSDEEKDEEDAKDLEEKQKAKEKEE